MLDFNYISCYINYIIEWVYDIIKQCEVYIMRKINYTEKWKELLTPEIVPLLTQIHEYKGEQNLFIESH